MRLEIENSKPDCFQEAWPGQYDIFHHYEFTSGVPSVIFLITTLKENGKPNACLHAWSTFSGDRGGFYAVLTGLMQNTHTYNNILRDREFCINFLDSSYYDNCIETINQNSDEDDELAIGGFTPEPAMIVKAPRIKEAFLTYECTLESLTDLSGAGINAMVVGKVQHVAVAEEFGNISSIASEGGFMFNIHCPKDCRTAEGDQSAIAYLKIQKVTG